jgi:hypothetical protein
MKKAFIVLAVSVLLYFLWPRSRRPSPRAVCPRGYYLVPGPNSYGGNPRVCMPMGEASSEDAIPAANYMPPLEGNVIQSL